MIDGILFRPNLVGGRIQVGQCKEQQIILNCVQKSRNGKFECFPRFSNDFATDQIAGSFKRTWVGREIDFSLIGKEILKTFYLHFCSRWRCKWRVSVFRTAKWWSNSSTRRRVGCVWSSATTVHMWSSGWPERARIHIWRMCLCFEARVSGDRGGGGRRTWANRKRKKSQAKHLSLCPFCRTLCVSIDWLVD